MALIMDPKDSHDRPHPHLERTKAIWARMNRYRKLQEIVINGQTLDVAGVVAVSRFGCKPAIDKSPGLQDAMNDSIATLNKYLSDGSYLYGVNTGFGGSADVRTTDLHSLQVALMQHTQSGIMVSSDTTGDHDELRHHTLPRAWVRGSMMVRANANIRGHSAMRPLVAETIMQLVGADCIPLVPLRGSISASGDLMPLSYIAGSVMGNPDITVQIGQGAGRQIMGADKALRKLGITPVTLGPKEGLSLINGTAPSAAVASLAVYDANNLCVVGQLLTAMTAEGLAANVEWAHPFIADVRPHGGQIEAAHNIRGFLKGSQLTTGLGARAKDRFLVGIAQERYALRSSPQWLAPVLEDLQLALSQVETELNSTSDNPVVNVAHDDVHCGANFQAASVTAAAEKTRFCLQMVGKLLFSQTTELINNTLNNGLPPNLAADDPSLSFCLKGVDANMAAYQSELAFLANPVSSHVQSAEMHNQSVNSLALLTSRYTMQAVEMVSLMSAAALYVTCQAIDLRVLHVTFLETLRPALAETLGRYHCGHACTNSASSLSSSSSSSALFLAVWRAVCDRWYETACLDAKERAAEAATAAVPVLADYYGTTTAATNGDGSAAAPTTTTTMNLSTLRDLRGAINQTVYQGYLQHRDAFFRAPSSAQYLGDGTRRGYQFVRETLGVPFHRGIEEQPGPSDTELPDGRPKKIIGSWLSVIYEAVRDGRLDDCLLNDTEEEK
ncbi:phenylalanine ammonia-lyase [Apiospora saccharicola]|uniref:Phenylalanine ammonia-lyase n=1 Tax=Apiospora saccharicola TaxID=335842 RepID=A0ABR1UP38_9PEZI